MPLSLREEFKLKRFGFQNINPGRFQTFQWRLPGCMYVLYRVTLAVYTIVWLALTREHVDDSNSPMGWGAYLTNWTYTLLTLFFTSNALVVVLVSIINLQTRRNLFRRLTASEFTPLFLEASNDNYEELADDDRHLSISLSLSSTFPWYYAIVWILFNAASVGALVVTVVFWAILVPGATGLGEMTVDNIQLHLINSILILLEHSVTAVPIRLLHCLYPVIYGLIYVLFSVFYWVDDHNHVMYDILNWNNAGPTTGWVILIGFVIIPFLHAVFYGIYRLKMFIFYKVYD